MTLNTVNKALKAVAVAAVALTSTVFQAGGCTIDVSNMGGVFSDLLGDLPTESFVTPSTTTISSNTSECCFQPSTGYDDWDSWDNSFWY